MNGKPDRPPTPTETLAFTVFALAMLSAAEAAIILFHAPLSALLGGCAR